MMMPLKHFRDDCLERLLRFLWKEWTSLGAAGQLQAPSSHVIDPEALVLFTASMGRYDQRLFDEMLDWLVVNGRFLNVQRLRNIVRQDMKDREPVLAAIADWLSRQDKPMKWGLLAKSDNAPQGLHPLFCLFDGRPMPVPSSQDPVFLDHGLARTPVRVRNHARKFVPDTIACHFLKLRALFGITARCDVMAYLTMNPSGHPCEIARELYYSQKAVHEVMTELAASGFVHSVKRGRERVFRIHTEALPFLTGGMHVAPWVNWPILFSTVEAAWRKVEELEKLGLEERLESSEITLAVRPLLQRLAATPWAPALPPFENRQGPPLLAILLDAFQSIAGT